ncbi:MAG TPA: isoprenylcysteine carboxylmethyltransferase family protein [Burkholderiaceae bacterium]|nr:isoprenylcysteine carboxylmethyltransferase family protein [Burkholderiaceae bacterium]
MAQSDRPPPDATWLELKIPPPAVVAIAAAAMWLLPAVATTPRLGPLHAWWAAALAAAGAAVALAGVIEFRRAHTTIDPRRPSAASALVVQGIYRYTRNPMYLGMLIVLLGWAVYLAKLSAFLALPLFVWYLTVFQIRPEERALRERFGAEFDAYAARVRRWVGR